MPVNSVWMLEESNITISGGAILDGVTQGSGTHLVGKTITLNAPSWLETFISDDDPNFADNDTGQRLSGAQTIGGVTYVNGTVVEAEYTLTLTNPTTGIAYTVIGYNVNNSAPSYGTVEGLAFIGPESAWPPIGTPLTVTKATEGPPQTGAGVTPFTSYVTPACFTPGILIATPQGPRLIEDLVAGDLVMTQADGPKPVRFVARTHVSAARMARFAALRPVRIGANAFGPGKPSRPLTLSPQHRIVLRGAACEMHFSEEAVLVAAKDLRAARPVPMSELAQGVLYLHLALDDHQILIADGIETESFQIGPEVFGAASVAVRAELRSLFPDIGADPAPKWQNSLCRSLTSWEARVLSA